MVLNLMVGRKEKHLVLTKATHYFQKKTAESEGRNEKAKKRKEIDCHRIEKGTKSSSDK